MTELGEYTGPDRAWCVVVVLVIMWQGSPQQQKYVRGSSTRIGLDEEVCAWHDHGRLVAFHAFISVRNT